MVLSESTMLFFCFSVFELSSPGVFYSGGDDRERLPQRSVSTTLVEVGAICPRCNIPRPRAFAIFSFVMCRPSSSKQTWICRWSVPEKRSDSQRAGTRVCSMRRRRDGKLRRQRLHGLAGFRPTRSQTIQRSPLHTRSREM